MKEEEVDEVENFYYEGQGKLEEEEWQAGLELFEAVVLLQEGLGAKSKRFMLESKKNIVVVKLKQNDILGATKALK